MKPVFRTFLSKNGFLLVFNALKNQVFSFALFMSEDENSQNAKLILLHKVAI